MRLERFQRRDYRMLDLVRCHVRSLYQNAFVCLTSEVLQSLWIVASHDRNLGAVPASDPKSQNSRRSYIYHLCD